MPIPPKFTGKRHVSNGSCGSKSRNHRQDDTVTWSEEPVYTSLLAEDQRRMQFMDQRLIGDLRSSGEKRNVFRQEEITEEIEVIMLSVEALLG